MSAADIRPLADVVKDAILEALAASCWSTGVAAKHLGISQRHIYNKLRDYGVSLPDLRRQAKLTFKDRKHF